jgi:hypothetical protein
MKILNENFGWGSDKIREFSGNLTNMLSELTGSSKVTKEQYAEYSNTVPSTILDKYFSKDPFSSGYIFTGSFTDFSNELKSYRND